ncbi:MBL fold metallo-hydrolase [Arthrobacter sp. ok362]|uniref:MBL fold metallo-hydrolase n=1 Tax=Arthrobacter sp. ok362 TaxID=1761745 RepID=UPI000B8265A4|nr:MBL fold metallo-hydrolase [Arthrobacter sp. ok362]
MTFPKVNVLPVGDGACTVLRPWPEREPGPSVVIDCGVRRAKSEDAAQMLLDSLGGTLSMVEAFVISHFDWDHWGGLKYLSKLSKVPQDLSSSTLYYPRMPKLIPTGLLAMLGGLGGTGSAALDLHHSLKNLLRTGETLSLCPLTAESKPIELAGEKFEVIWPPREIGKSFSRRLHGAVEAVEDLAARLKEDGYPELQRNLDFGSLATEFLADLEINDDVDADSSQPAPKNNELESSFEDERGDDDYESAGERWSEQDDELTPPALLSLPLAWHDEYKKVLKRIRRANNDLSLVLASETGGIVCFGDIGGPALREALISLKDRHFGVMLAPHHGTHPFPPGMPSSRWCIAQGGPDHGPQWKKIHSAQPHKSHRCWNTHYELEFTKRRPAL